MRKIFIIRNRKYNVAISTIKNFVSGNWIDKKNFKLSGKLNIWNIEYMEN